MRKRAQTRGCGRLASIGSGAGSLFDGRGHLGGDSRRLVGVAPEALVRLEQRLYDTKKIRVDFVRALEGEGMSRRDSKVQQMSLEVNSASGFQPGREHDIVVDSLEKYVREEDVAHAVTIIEGGGKYPAQLIKDFKKTLERNLNKKSGE